MGKTVYYTAVSLDGYIADEHHSLDWLFQFGDADEDDFGAFIKDVGAVAMGSSTYQWLLDNYIYADPESPKPWPHAQPTWVFSSRSLPTIPGADIRFVQGSIGPAYEHMRTVAEGRDIWVAGGGDLAGQFYEQGALDEIILTVAPVILSKGAPLFTRRIATPPLDVLEVVPHRNGMTGMRLAVPKTRENTARR